MFQLLCSLRFSHLSCSLQIRSLWAMHLHEFLFQTYSTYLPASSTGKWFRLVSCIELKEQARHADGGFIVSDDFFLFQVALLLISFIMLTMEDEMLFYATRSAVYAELFVTNLKSSDSGEDYFRQVRTAVHIQSHAIARFLGTCFHCSYEQLLSGSAPFCSERGTENVLPSKDCTKNFRYPAVFTFALVLLVVFAMRLMNSYQRNATICPAITFIACTRWIIR